jgi:endonuclease YncB( thermonuclease family)
MDGIAARLRFHKDALARAFAFTTAVVTVCAAVIAGSTLRDPSRNFSGMAAATASDAKDQSRLDRPTTAQISPATPPDSRQGANDMVTPAGAPIGSWRHEDFTFVEVIDGRTFRAGGTTIRLAGLELPAADQVCRTLDNRLEQCAARAATQLELLTRSRALACRYHMITSSEAVGSCRIGAHDLAARMIRTGYAQRATDADEVQADAPPRG